MTALKLNPHFDCLQENYLFAEVARRAQAHARAHPGQELLCLGVGDATLPLPPPVLRALHAAVDEMGRPDTFRGYGPAQGYPFLRRALQAYYAARGAALEQDAFFVSDGAKSDLGNLLDLFDADNTVLIPDPVYPVYVDTNRMAGRPLRFVRAAKENAFLPPPPAHIRADLIYLCSPNNPTGAVYSKDQLAAWVAYAAANGAVLLFDAAYACFIRDDTLPRSIYEVEGAQMCAIEIGSFSKMAGFTGTRCGYTVVPHALVRQGKSLHALWQRRQATKFNGVAYVVQRAAAAVLTPEGQAAAKAAADTYLHNARRLAEVLQAAGVWHCGAANSPYVWMQCPRGMASWDFFNFLLTRAGLVGTPGAGFGPSGEGYFRLTGFGSPHQTATAARRLQTALELLS